VRVDIAKHIAKGKGVHREIESEGSRRQTSGLTNRNHIRKSRLGNETIESKIIEPKLPIGFWNPIIKFEE
jgi:hypothetical protein